MTVHVITRKILAVALFTFAAPATFHLHGVRALAAPYAELPGLASHQTLHQAVPLLPDEDVSYLQVHTSYARGRKGSASERAEKNPDTPSDTADTADSSTPPSTEEVPAPSQVTISSENDAAPVDSASSPSHCSGQFGLRVPCSRSVPWPLVGGLSYWPGMLVTHPSVLYIFEVWSSLGKLQELVFFPILLWLLWFSQYWLLQCIVLVQLATHVTRLMSDFKCDPVIWCNLTALAFGVLYMVFASMSLVFKDEDRKPIRSKLVSCVTLFAAGYIVVSHGVAVIYYEQYKQILPFLFRQDASPAAS